MPSKWRSSHCEAPLARILRGKQGQESKHNERDKGRARARHVLISRSFTDFSWIFLGAEHMVHLGWTNPGSGFQGDAFCSLFSAFCGGLCLHLPGAYPTKNRTADRLTEHTKTTRAH